MAQPGATREKHLLAIGDANTDIVIRLPASPGERVPPPELHGGGTISNTAVGVRRLGVSVRFAGAVGDDGYGRFVADDLAREGVDIDLLVTTRRDFTVSVFAVIQADGERTITVWPPEGGAHSFLEPQHVPDTAVRNAGWVHTSGIALRRSPVRETILHVAEVAHAAGIPVSLDLNLRLEYWGWQHEILETVHRLLPFVSTVFGSLDDEIRPLAEALAESSTRASSPATAERDAMAALASPGRSVVARKGADGASLRTRSGELTSAPAAPVPVVDSLGAGDAFNAGFIAARLRGLDEAEALHWGLCASAYQVARPGARALPTLPDLTTCLQR
jgi:sugar/nucleoside kinase (ribokinase family)